MHCAIKALILILLCRSSFAAGLNSGSTQALYGFTETEVQLLPSSRIALSLLGENLVFMRHNLKFKDEFDSGLPPLPSPSRILPSPSASAGRSPEPVIVGDPTPLPEVLFEDQAKKIALQILASQVRFQYILYDLLDAYRRKFMVIERFPRAQDIALPDTGFQFILLALPDEAYLIDDPGTSRFSPRVNSISNSVLQYILSIIVPVDAQYVAIYNDDGTVVVKILYANGHSRIMTREEILMKFGEWFYEFFDKFFEHFAGYAEPYAARYQSQSVVIPRKAPKKPAKGDPESKKGEPVDGQTGSKSGSGKKAPPVPESTKDSKVTAGDSPDPPSDHPLYSTQSSKDSGASPVVPVRGKVKPIHRFKVAKATSELIVAEDLRSNGIQKLTKAISKKELKQHFQDLDGFPAKKSPSVQITWLLDNGVAIRLSRLIVEKATQQWLDSTTLTLIGRQLQRARSTRRTRIVSRDSAHYRPGLVRELEKFMPLPENGAVIQAAKARHTDQAALKPVLGRGWQIVIANGKKSPIYHSAQQRGLLTTANTPNLEEKLTISTQTALEYLLWDDLEALRVGKLIAKLVPLELEKMIRDAFQSSSAQPGVIERELDIGRAVRLVDHPAAGGGHLLLGPSQKHIKVSYFSESPHSEYVVIEISIEFSHITTASPIREQSEIPLTLVLKSAYKYTLGSSHAVAIPDERVVIASDPASLLPPLPTPTQIQQWIDQLHGAQTKIFYDNMKKHEERLRDWESRESIRPPADIVKLTADSRKLKSAMQFFTINYDYVKNWNDLSAEQLESLTQKLLEAMKEYQQLLDSVLDEGSLFQGSTHPEGWNLVQGYRKYVQDMEAVYLEMMRIYQRRLNLTREDFERIEELTKLSEEIGGRARNLQIDELPVLRARLRNSGLLTDEQYVRTEQLRNLYYPLVSGFNIARAQVLFQPPQYADIVDDEQRRSFISVHDEYEETDHPAVPEFSPLEVTLPFTYDQEDIEGEALQDPGPDTDDGIPVDVTFDHSSSSDSD